MFTDSLSFVPNLASLAKGAYWEISGEPDPWLKNNRNLHHGEAAIILGNGPSLNDVDQVLLERVVTFGTNGVFLKHVPDYYVTISRDYFRNHLEEIRAINSFRKFVPHDIEELNGFNLNTSVLKCIWPCYGNFFGNNFAVPRKFSTKADKITYLGGSVLFVCLQVAYWLGFTKVVLLGVDHNFESSGVERRYGGQRVEHDVARKSHFHKNYSLPSYTPHCDILATERGFELANRAFLRDGRCILNASEGSKLDVFPKIKVEDLEW